MVLLFSENAHRTAFYEEQYEYENNRILWCIKSSICVQLHCCDSAMNELRRPCPALHTDKVINEKDGKRDGLIIRRE